MTRMLSSNLIHDISFILILFNKFYNKCRKRFGWRNRKECFEVLILPEQKILVLAPPHPFCSSYYLKDCSLFLSKTC